MMWNYTLGSLSAMLIISSVLARSAVSHTVEYYWASTSLLQIVQRCLKRPACWRSLYQPISEWSGLIEARLQRRECSSRLRNLVNWYSQIYESIWSSIFRLRSVGAGSFCSTYSQPNTTVTSNLDVSRLAPLLRILQSKFTITTLKIVELVGEKAASIIANTDLIQSLNNCALRHYFNCIDHLWREAYSYSTYLMIQTASIDHATCHKNFLQLPDYELFQTEIGVGSYCNPLFDVYLRTYLLQHLSLGTFSMIDIVLNTNR